MSRHHTTPETIVFSPSAPPGGVFVSRWLVIHREAATGWTITLWAGFPFDGASLFPDRPRMMKRSVPLHDAIYEKAEAIAQAWGWSVRRVCEWANRVMWEAGTDDREDRRVMAFAFWFCQRGGYEYHVLARFFRRLTGRA